MSIRVLWPSVHPSCSTTRFHQSDSCRIDDYSRDLRQAEWGSPVILRSSNSASRMVAMGQKRTLCRVEPMSALPPKADITADEINVRFVPIPTKVRRNMATYSITSSARADSVTGKARASCFAVLRLITNSTFVDCSTGRSAGLAPLRIRPV